VKVPPENRADASHRFGGDYKAPPPSIRSGSGKRPTAETSNRDAAIGCGAVLLGLLIVGGCVAAVTGDDDAAQRSPRPAESIAASPRASAGPAPSEVRSAAPNTETPTAQASVPRLIGYAATRAEWDRTHEAAPGYIPGSAYLPFVRARQPRYAAVSGDDRILSYSYFFAEHTTLEMAMREILRNEFPKDARYGRTDRDEPHCLLVEVLSEQVEDAMNTAEDGYRPLVGFFSEPPPEDPDAPLNPAAVDNAVLTLVEADAEADLGMC
jgi:hypothetical protein